MDKYFRIVTRSVYFIIVFIALYLVSKLFKVPEEVPIYIIIIFVAIFGVIFSVIIQLLSENLLPKAYRVAIVGFPSSGKTTLIVTLFREIFAQRIRGVKARLRGRSTIEKVNEYLEQLDEGIALGPTKDQDIFAFRADVTMGKFPFPRTYKMEFGDFPGESSAKYAIHYGSWLHSTEYFKWVIESDAIIFIIDLSRYLVKVDIYTALMSKAIRAAWQHYLESNILILKSREIRKRKVLIIFTKADVFKIERDPASVKDASRQKINRAGMSTKIPKMSILSYEDYKEGSTICKEYFSDLIKYLKSETKNFDILFTSSFAFYDDIGEIKIGINEILKKLLA